MSHSWILKLPQADEPDRSILIHVSRKDSSKHDLDLDLLATDGDDAFVGKVRNRDFASKIKAKHFNDSDDQFASILQYVLVYGQKSGIDDVQRENLEVVCSKSGKDSKAKLTIFIRTKIEDIIHRLGSVELTLSQTQNVLDSVDLFGWCSQVVSQRDELGDKLLSTSRDADAAGDRIRTLENELNGLIKAKQEHEDQMLSKFALLLNEKKSKIRHQQRILSTAKVDATKLSELQLTGNPDRQVKRGTKRSRDKSENSYDGTDEESDAFEEMQVDPANDDSETAADRDRTPDRVSDDEDDSEIAVQRRGSAIDENMGSPPPPRSLPFVRSASHGSKSTKLDNSSRDNNCEGDEDTASEDYEL